MITTAPLRVKTAATIICIRQSTRTKPGKTLTKMQATGGVPAWDGVGRDGSGRMQLVFGEGQDAVFGSCWEVLMGQREVQNWVRSTPDKPVAMRYAGEWTFAGGTVDPGETPEQAAIRELKEEFHVTFPENCVPRLHLLSVKQTRPISNVSNIMYNFIATAEENPWLAKFSIEEANIKLAQRRDSHASSVHSGEYWSLSKHEKELMAPEVHEIKWFDMQTAVLHAFRSMNSTLIPVNDFQREDMLRFGIQRRDPMYLTMVSLLEVDSFPSLTSLRRYTNKFDAGAELHRMQWLHDGMSPAEVLKAWGLPPNRSQRQSMFGTLEERMLLFKERAIDDDKEVHSNAHKVTSRM